MLKVKLEKINIFTNLNLKGDFKTVLTQKP